ncbi:MAG: hypothetical protein ACTS5A_02980 [Candidatus Hodgkinia cicadicola]
MNVTSEGTEEEFSESRKKRWTSKYKRGSVNGSWNINGIMELMRRLYESWT